MSETELRGELVARARELDRSGLNRGSSGNVSARCGDMMLITPSAVASDVLDPGMIARMPVDGEDCTWEGPKKPSTEWRIHLGLMRARPEIGAIVHTHAPFSTILAIARKPIPAIHYMMAAFGGADIRVAGYASYGTEALSAQVVAAMEGRNGCLMANHGMLTAGPNLTRATWLAHELEALAHQYYHLLAIGEGHVLSETDLAEARKGFASYGVNGAAKSA